jgi:hypothetical protein
VTPDGGATPGNIARMTTVFCTPVVVYPVAEYATVELVTAVLAPDCTPATSIAQPLWIDAPSWSQRPCLSWRSQISQISKDQSVPNKGSNPCAREAGRPQTHASLKQIYPSYLHGYLPLCFFWNRSEPNLYPRIIFTINDQCSSSRRLGLYQP